MSRGMTTVAEALRAVKGTMPEYNPLTNTYPKFKYCDGNLNTLTSWLLDATYEWIPVEPLTKQQFALKN